MAVDAESSFLPVALPTAGPDGQREPGHAWESYYADLRQFVARQLGGEQDADDVVQDIYRELLHSRCAEATNPRAWIWKIAWRVVHETFRREKRQRRHYVVADPKSIETLRADRLFAAPPADCQLEAQDELDRVLSDLPLATQLAVVRSRCDGWTYEQIAVELGVTPHMVKKHIGRAIAHFDAYLEKADAQSAPKGVRS